MTRNEVLDANISEEDESGLRLVPLMNMLVKQV